MPSKITWEAAGGGRMRLPIALAAAVLWASGIARAQDADSTSWRLVGGPPATTWRAPDTREVQVAAASALAHLQRSGHFLARIDSVRGRTLFASRGPAAVVDELVVVGASRLDESTVRRALGPIEGRPLAPGRVDSALSTLTARYARSGRLLATVTPEIEVDAAGKVRLAVRIDEGPALPLGGVELIGARRTRPGLAARAAGLEVGAELAEFDPEAIRRDLLATGIFEFVGRPAVAVVDGRAMIRVPVREGAPGAFDLLLGYLPTGAADGGGAVVGSGRLEVRNLFGGGRALRLALVRDPGLTASVDLRASDPYVLGLPLRLAGQFEGYGRDSTFSRQRYRVELGYRVAPGLELTAAGAREAVQPGPFGSRPVPGDSTGRPRVAGAEAAFGGFGIRYARVDAPAAPRRGLVVDILAERGRRRRTLPDSVAADASVVQQRLEAIVRVYAPTFRRQGIVAGADARVILGGRGAAGGYDEGELYRIGGAASLRGYDEDTFSGDAVGRVLAEYRYALDGVSYAFVFFDVGYVRRPATPEASANDDVLPGYGFGVQYSTPLGIATLTYALNPDIGAASGKVHVGLAFGL